jgi:hypothetical protein
MLISRRTKLVLYGLGGLASLCVLSLMALAWVVTTHTPKEHRFLIPEGYAGWLCIYYGVSNASALPREDGFSVVRFDETGVVETSEVGLGGDTVDEHWFYKGLSRRRLDIEKEMGGGFTEGNRTEPGRYMFTFWVSPNARVDQPPWTPNTPHRCGLHIPSK